MMTPTSLPNSNKITTNDAGETPIVNDSNVTDTAMEEVNINDESSSAISEATNDVSNNAIDTVATKEDVTKSNNTKILFGLSKIASEGTESSAVSSSTSAAAKEVNINYESSSSTMSEITSTVIGTAIKEVAMKMPEIFSEGTEVTKVKKGAYVGKIKKVRKKGNKVKYQIEWYSGEELSSYFTGSVKTSFTEDKEWYDSSLVKKLDKKRKQKPRKRFSFDENNTSISNLVPEKEKIRVFKEARKAILLMPCEYPVDKLNEALHEEGYPYGLQGVMNRLLEKVGVLPTKFPKLSKQTKLKPIKTTPLTANGYHNDNINSIQLHSVDLTGKIIRKTFNHMEHEGVVMYKHDEHHPDHELLYHIKYDDGDEEDLDGYEVIRHLYPRVGLQRCLGRRLQCLELFAGTCVVSDAFYYREWDCLSMDINTSSNAIMKRDILHVEPEDIAQVPDFIWASPPCETYSLLAGGIHRCLRDNELDRSPKARQHNYIFMKMVQIMTWAKIRHPHLIVVIENPVGKLVHMPLMKEFERHFKLQPVQVHYCAFGRDERKATLLWTNYPNLKDHLEDFKCCIHRCSVGMKHLGVRTNTKNFDFSSIPEPLATEVARVVDAKFTLDKIHRLEAAHPRDDIGVNSSLLIEESKARNCHYPLTTVPSNAAILEVEVE